MDERSLKSLQDIFPQLPRDVLDSLWRGADGSLSNAVDAGLALIAVGESEQQVPSREGFVIQTTSTEARRSLGTPARAVSLGSGLEEAASLEMMPVSPAYVLGKGELSLLQHLSQAKRGKEVNLHPNFLAVPRSLLREHARRQQAQLREQDEAAAAAAAAAAALPNGYASAALLAPVTPRIGPEANRHRSDDSGGAPQHEGAWEMSEMRRQRPIPVSVDYLSGPWPPPATRTASAAYAPPSNPGSEDGSGSEGGSPLPTPPRARPKDAPPPPLPPPPPLLTDSEAVGALPPGTIYRVTVDKSAAGLGLAVREDGPRFLVYSLPRQADGAPGPAEEAGVRPGDALLGIEELDFAAEPWTLPQLVQYMRDISGVVTLRLQRGLGLPLDRESTAMQAPLSPSSVLGIAGGGGSGGAAGSGGRLPPQKDRPGAALVEVLVEEGLAVEQQSEDSIRLLEQIADRARQWETGELWHSLSERAAVMAAAPAPSSPVAPAGASSGGGVGVAAPAVAAALPGAWSWGSTARNGKGTSVLPPPEAAAAPSAAAGGGNGKRESPRNGPLDRRRPPVASVGDKESGLLLPAASSSPPSFSGASSPVAAAAGASSRQGDFHIDAIGAALLGGSVFAEKAGSGAAATAAAAAAAAAGGLGPRRAILGDDHADAGPVVPTRGLRKALSLRILHAGNESLSEGGDRAGRGRSGSGGGGGNSGGGDATSATTYCIWVQDVQSGAEWRVWRRFRQFHELYERVCRLRPSLSRVDFPPRLPPGSVLKESLGVAADRRARLEAFLRRLASMIYMWPLRPESAEIHRVLGDFLEVSSRLEALVLLQRSRPERELRQAIQVQVWQYMLLPTLSRYVSNLVERLRPERPENTAAAAAAAAAVTGDSMLAELRNGMDRLQAILSAGCYDELHALVLQRLEAAALFAANGSDTAADPSSGDGGDGSFRWGSTEPRGFVRFGSEDEVAAMINGSIRRQVESEIFVPVMERLYGRLREEMRDEEARSQAAIRWARNKPQSFYGIPVCDISPSSWDSAVFHLSAMTSLTLPCAKLDALVAAAHEVPALHQREHPHGKHGDGRPQTLGADTFLPIFIYVTVSCDIPDIAVTARLLEALCDPTKKLGETGYYVATFQAVLEHVVGLAAAAAAKS